MPCRTWNHKEPSRAEPSRAEPKPLAWRRWAVTGAAVVSGSVLLAAAVFKFVGWNVSPFAQYGWLLSPTVQSFAVIEEVLLGVWLLSRRSPFLSWLAAVLTFASFAVVSGYLGVIGQATCGCFGVIKASPWTAFAVDVAALTLLAVGRPSLASRAEIYGSLKWAGLLAGVFALLAVAGVLIDGSLDAAVARLRGQSLDVTPSTLDFGTGKPGEVLTVPLTVRNYSSHPVRLIGGTSDCSCLTTGDMPVTIPAGERVTISVKLKVPAATAGELNRSVEVFTDCPNHQTLRLSAGCRVE